MKTENDQEVKRPLYYWAAEALIQRHELKESDVINIAKYYIYKQSDGKIKIE